MSRPDFLSPNDPDRTANDATNSPMSADPVSTVESGSRPFRVLDLVALTLGVAIAGVHLRAVLPEGPVEMPTLLVFAGGVMLGIGVTATGPFLLLIRCVLPERGRPIPIGEWLWGLLGAPWLIGATFRLIDPEPMSDQALLRFEFFFGLSLILAIGVAATVVLMTWVASSPERASQVLQKPWTNRLGYILAILWPLQCGLGLFAMS